MGFFIALISFDYLTNSDYVIDFPDRETRYFFVGIVYIIVITIIFFTFRQIRINYERQSDKIKEQRNALNVSKVELEHANAKLTKVLSVLAHDVRSPLVSIKSYIELLKMDVEISTDRKIKITEDLSIMVDGTSKMVDDILDWSSLKVKGNGLNLKDSKLKDWLPQTLYSLEKIAKTKGIHFSFNFDENLNLVCDSTLLAIVIRNIVTNALKFTSSGKNVNLDIRKVNNQCIIKISDEGVGMPKTQIEKIFSNKIESKNGVRDEQGKGLGLLISKEYIDAHNGTINVKSKQNFGTTFTIKLPILTVNND